MPNLTKIQQHLDSRTQAIRAKYGMPNIAGVLVRSNGNTVMHSVDGVRDISKSKTAAGNRMTKDQFFNVGSISKPITGLLIACLIKQKVMSWNTKVGDVFPEFREKAFRQACGMREHFLDSKVYELMSHVSGVDGTYYFDEYDAAGVQKGIGDTDPWRYMGEAIAEGGTARDEEWQNLEAVRYMRYLYAVLSMKKEKFRFKRSRNLRHDNQAGSGYGSAVIICVAMAERLLGRPWEAIVTQLLFDPLASLRIINGPLPDKVQLHGFNSSTGKYEVVPRWNNAMAAYGAKFPVGGIHCTVDGMAEYMKYNLVARNYAAAFDVAAYQTPVAEATRGGLYTGGSGADAHLWHNGYTFSSMALTKIYHQAGRGFSVMSNSATGSNDDWLPVNELMTEMEAIHADWNARRFR